MKEIQLTNSEKKILCDDEDFEILSKFKWHLTESGYARYATMRFHRVVMNAQKGDIVDHKDGNRLDNRKINLRFCSNMQNAQNAKLSKLSTTGFKGVSYEKNMGSFSAKICINGRKVRIGNYETAELAAKGYDLWAITHFGEFARVNFPENKEFYEIEKEKPRVYKRVTDYIRVKGKERSSPNKGNRTGFLGVFFSKQRNKYIAEICVNKKKMYLGSFDDALSASKAYEAAVKKYITMEQ